MLFLSSHSALDRAKAQYLRMAGKKAQASGWPPGRYVATYTVRRGGKVVISRTFETTL